MPAFNIISAVLCNRDSFLVPLDCVCWGQPMHPGEQTFTTGSAQCPGLVWWETALAAFSLTLPWIYPCKQQPVLLIPLSQGNQPLGGEPNFVLMKEWGFNPEDKATSQLKHQTGECSLCKTTPQPSVSFLNPLLVSSSAIVFTYSTTVFMSSYQQDLTFS